MSKCLLNVPIMFQGHIGLRSKRLTIVEYNGTI